MTKTTKSVKPTTLRKDVNEINTRARRGTRAKTTRTPASVRVNVAYATTMIRVVYEDKETFDMMLREFMHRVDERVSHHEFFAHILAYAVENMPEIISRWKLRNLSYAGERALAAAVAELNGTSEGGPAA